MNFWKMISYRYEKEELAKWPALRKIGYLLLPLLVYFAVHDISQMLLWMLVELLMQQGGEGVVSFFGAYAYTAQGTVNGLAILLGVLSIWPTLQREIRKAEPGAHGSAGKAEPPISSEGRAQVFLLYGGLALLAFSLALGLNLLFEQIGFTESSAGFVQVRGLQYGVQLAVGLFLYGVVSPLAEEAVFRGLVYNRMKRCFGLLPALVVSSFLFGFYHGNTVQAVYGIILGLVMAWLYERYASFAAPVLFHAVANVSIYLLTYDGALASVQGEIAWTITAITLAVSALLLFFIKRKTDGNHRKNENCTKSNKN